jgi:hypothetical protein
LALASTHHRALAATHHRALALSETATHHRALALALAAPHHLASAEAATHHRALALSETAPHHRALALAAPHHRALAESATHHRALAGAWGHRLAGHSRHARPGGLIGRFAALGPSRLVTLPRLELLCFGLLVLAASAPSQLRQSLLNLTDLGFELLDLALRPFTGLWALGFF